jgi:hypothetical protein
MLISWSSPFLSELIILFWILDLTLLIKVLWLSVPSHHVILISTWNLSLLLKQRCLSNPESSYRSEPCFNLVNLAKVLFVVNRYPKHCIALRFRWSRRRARRFEPELWRSTCMKLKKTNFLLFLSKGKHRCIPPYLRFFALQLSLSY